MDRNNQRPLAVISGGSRGIGAALIREFCAQGFDVATYSRTEDALVQLRDEMKKDFAATLFFQAVDARSTPEILRFAEYVSSLGRPVMALINNAGSFSPGSLGDEPSGTMEDMMQVNFYSAYHLTRGLLPGMRSRRMGHIINICSIASVQAYPKGGSYSVSKTALLGFGRNLREETKAEGIRVTNILPGATYTDSWSGSGVAESRLMPVSDLVRAVWMCHELSDRSVVEELLLRPQLGDL